MVIAVGVTGTRAGGTPEQLTKARLVLASLWRPGIVLHHGKCIGGDEQMHRIGRELEYVIEQHPPTNRALESIECDVRPGEVVHDRRPYADRNRDIVDSVGRLIVIPQYPENDPRSLRSGTWMTARYAARQGIELDIIRPTEWPA